MWTVLVPPTIALDLPLAGAVTLLGDAAPFAAEVSDADSAGDERVVTWESDLDGVFYEGHASLSGTAAFQSTGLSAGAHALTATVTDPSGLQAVAVGAITIDGPPTAPSVSLSPSAPTTRDALVVSIDAPATDPDGDALTYAYAWSVDGRASTASASGTLPASATTAGEVWTVAVSATDGFATSPVGTASATIVSSGPVVTNVTVTPTSAAVGQTPTCTATAEDADGTALAVTYAWSTGAASSTVDGADVLDGEVWTCTVVADEGLDASEPGVATVTVGSVFPATCQEVRDARPTAGDGAESGTPVTTVFTRVRVDPVTFRVDANDFTVSASTGECHTWTHLIEIGWSVAASCDGWASGRANVDISGTPCVFQAGSWTVQGWLASGTATYSADNKVVDLTGGGYMLPADAGGDSGRGSIPLTYEG